MVKELDATSTVQEVAQAAKSLRLAQTIGIAVGLIVAVIALFVIGTSTFGGSPLAIIALVVVAAAAYRVVYEILARTLPPN